MGIAILAFPIMLLAGFVTHPNLFSLTMVTTVEDWISEWRGVFMFHLGHLLVLFAVPLIIASAVRFMSLLNGAAEWYGFVGGILAVFGAFMLAVDKGALTFVLTAFQTIPDPQFEQAMPAYQAIFDRAGWLWITWGFITLPLGFVVLILGLLKERIIPRWQGVAAIIGLILLINPDIEIISSVGATLMCAGLIPIGLREIAGKLE